MATGGMGTGGMSNDTMTAMLGGAQFYINCQPIVSTDPVIGFFGAAYDNTSGSTPAIATVTDATITMSNGSLQSLMWSFNVMPPSSGAVAAGGTANQNHTKVTNSGTGTGTGSPCSYCTSNSTWTLAVTWNIGGNVVNDTLNMGAVSCVF
jgi:hypothetical protein